MADETDYERTLLEQGFELFDFHYDVEDADAEAAELRERWGREVRRTHNPAFEFPYRVWARKASG